MKANQILIMVSGKLNVISSLWNKDHNKVADSQKQFVVGKDKCIAHNSI